MNLKILVATHKSYWMPEDKVYFPIQVGRAIAPQSLSYTGDDTGEHISEKNKTFCELTAVYWAWKNLKDVDAIGLCHYRRYFGAKRTSILSQADYTRLLAAGNDCILPKKRNYFIETNYSQYVHAHHEEDLILTKAILTEKYPDYLPAWEAVMKSTSGHRFNMFVMKWDLFDAYCTWLFDILFELEKRLDISTYSDYDKRVFGFVSERLIDVYLLTQKPSIATVPMVNLESQHWPKKIFHFLLRKFGIKR
ncbi:MAG: DUF4422 domain-containing protein [bacterium]|nr:DUF4422 domain-containing protein [bacterium]